MKKFGFLALFAILFGFIASFHAEASTKISKEVIVKSSKMMFSPTLTISWSGRGRICVRRGSECTVTITIERNAQTTRTGNPPGSIWGVMTSEDGAAFVGDPPVLEAGDFVFSPGEYNSDDGYAQTVSIPLQNVEYDPQLGGYVFYYFEH